ncbi:MAG: vWA domain-containing protein [Anaerolineae bacterium]
MTGGRSRPPPPPGPGNGWGTRIDRGLDAAHAVLSDQARPFGRPVAILLTDGLQNGSDSPVRRSAARVRSLGAEVYTIGLGPDVDADLLRAIATTPDDYMPAPQAADLEAMYRRISVSLDCPRSP